jgi:hypothetical protein
MSGIQGIQAKKAITTEGGGDRSNERNILVRSGFSTTQTTGCSPLNQFLRNCKKYNIASASDRTKFLKLEAINRNYNDSKFGGDQSNGSFTALKHIRH